MDSLPSEPIIWEAHIINNKHTQHTFTILTMFKYPDEWHKCILQKHFVSDHFVIITASVCVFISHVKIGSSPLSLKETKKKAQTQ